jgi:hypothetical protein
MDAETGELVGRSRSFLIGHHSLPAKLPVASQRPASPCSETVGLRNGQPVTGYCIINADDLDAALAVAKDSPLDGGMSVKVAEASAM